MKASKIKFLAGGIAAVMILSNMALLPVYGTELPEVEIAAEAAAEETETEEAPAEEAAAEETETEEAPAAEKPAEEAGTEEAPAAEKPAEEAMTEEEPAGAPIEGEEAEESEPEEEEAEETEPEEEEAGSEEIPAAEEAAIEEKPAEEAEPEKEPDEGEAAVEKDTSDEETDTKEYVPGNVLTEGVGTSDDTKDEDFSLGAAGGIINSSAQKLMNTSLDLLDQAIPGGKYLAEGIKMVIGKMLAGEDATAAALKNLTAQEENHFNQLSSQIGSLNDDVEKYARLLDNKIVNQGNGTTLGNMFREMNKNLIDLSDSITAIKNSSDYTPEQKLVLIADLNNSQYLKDLRQATYTIDRNTISTGEDVFDLDLFDTLLSINSENKMFKSEAYDATHQAISALMAQYIYANTLLLECQNAGNALDFTPDQMAALGEDAVFTEAYKRCKRPEQVNFLKSKQDQTIKRLSNCLDGLAKFEDIQYSGNAFIKENPGAPMVLEFSEELHDNVKSAEFKKMCDGQYFDQKKMKEFAEYIQKATGGKKSAYEFLKDNYQYLDLSSHAANKDSDDYNNHRYIVIDPTITTTSVRNPSKDYTVTYKLRKGIKDSIRYHVSDVTETIKVIDIYDPECKVQDLIVRTFERNDQPDTGDKNIVNYSHSYIKIGAHAPTETDRLMKDAGGKLAPQSKKTAATEDIFGIFNTLNIGRVYPFYIELV